MLTALILKPITSRLRVFVGSSVAMVATDLAGAKITTMLTNAKIASMHATKLVATKVIAKATALWLFVMSCFMPIQQPAQVAQNPIPQKAHHRVVAASTPAPAVIEIQEKPLFLHTLEKAYTCVFTGKLSCGQGACQDAAVQIHIATRKNPNLIRNATVMPDGTYQLSVLINEFENEHLDWWITADSPDSVSKQLQGREILMEDSNIQIEHAIALL